LSNSYRRPAETNIDIDVNRRGPRDSIDVEYDRRQNRDEEYGETQIDITEREYRRRTDPNFVDIEYERRRPAAGNDNIEREDIKVNVERKSKMGYYDDEGNYHSFRRGLERAADRVMHPFHHHHDRGEVDVNVEVNESGPSRVREGNRENVRFVERRGDYPKINTVPIPCHFIRIGDLVILQGRPCQIIRISTSPQTGQYRYLGVDLFTRQLQEESSFVSNPQPSVIVQSMLGPVYKQYRILDMRDDGRLVCMTESGDVKQGLSVIDQGGLYSKIERAFSEHNGSVRALIINDGGRELVVDYKVVHGSRL
jgi:hypothetical protein